MAVFIITRADGTDLNITEFVVPEKKRNWLKSAKQLLETQFIHLAVLDEYERDEIDGSDEDVLNAEIEYKLICESVAEWLEKASVGDIMLLPDHANLCSGLARTSITRVSRADVSQFKMYQRTVVSAATIPRVFGSKKKKK